MREERLRGLAMRLFWLGAGLIATASSGRTQTLPASNSDVPPVPVYVNDFELAVRASSSLPSPGTVSTPAGTAKRPESTAPDGQPSSPPIVLETDPPHVQARKIQDFFANTLTETLQKSGFTAKREAGHPDSGVMLRGVFAEVDPLSRVRKAVLGSASTSLKLTLYVGTFNLARPDQPLYQMASAQDHDQRFGPIITLNNYVPMDKYELSKNPTEEDIRRICGQIANKLEQLIKQNQAAFAH